MNFSLEFPTLQRLALVYIGKRLINRRKRQIFRYSRRKLKFHDPSIHLYKSKYKEIYMSKIQKVVQQFPIPVQLQHALFDVMMGISFQVWNWFNDHRYIYLRGFISQEILFDIHGVLDGEKTCKTYIDKVISRSENYQFYENLLNLACRQFLLPDINFILQKMFVAPGTIVSMSEEPTIVIKRTKMNLVYSFVGKWTLSNDNPVQNNNEGNGTQGELSSTVTCSLAKRYLSKYIMLKLSKSNIVVSYEHPFSSRSLSEFLKVCKPHHKLHRTKIIACLAASLHNTEFVSYVLSSLDSVSQMECLNISPQNILSSFLQWPYTELVIPLVKSCTTVHDAGYLLLLRDIFERFSCKSPFGSQFQNLIYQLYCDNSEVKECFRQVTNSNRTQQELTEQLFEFMRDCFCHISCKH